ncbi:MAG: hypothetical protein JWO06_2657, partial [Bacteroidota bacterium]|nr:hypothetical protein [Bacteroidota bacterium]
MKNVLLCFCFALFLNIPQTISAQAIEDKNCTDRIEEKDGDELQFPYDNFFIQRSYPDYKDILPGLENAKRIARQQMNNYARGFNFDLQWQIEGPTDIGGRVDVVAVDPTDSNVIYTGTANGGIFKSIDAGVSWFSVVDTLSYFAVGDIKIDPTDHNTIYVGLGDPNISGYPAIGNGVLKSIDAGATWHNIGLYETRVISKIEIHPLNHNIVYAGAMGLPYAKNNQRGLYKSNNGGQTWSQVLFVNDSAGIIDVMLDNTDTNVVYAVSWNRIRQNLKGLIAGPDAKIWKSINGGASWTQLSNGLPTGSFSRIAIAKSSQNHNLLYAEYVDSATLDLQGIYKSTDAGASWTALDVSQLTSQQVQGGFGWYFGNLAVNPYNDSQIYVLGVDMWTTSDGLNWGMVGPAWWTYDLHADKHCLRFVDQNKWLVATDGGLFQSLNAGNTWTPINTMPNTQFYHVSYSVTHPGLYYGGAQDNGTTSGNISNINLWPRNYGGDGFQQRFHPTDPSIWYTETQNGAIAYTDNDGGSFQDATAGIDGNDIRNWDMPYILSSADPNTMYTGTNRIYQSTGSYIPNWRAISLVLTDATSTIDNTYRNISTIDECSLNTKLLYVGTSDGKVWRTTDQGLNWQNISSTLPNRYVTHVKASNVHNNVVFVSHSGYKDNDNIPHIHMSIDSGSTWTDISGDLPPFAVNHIELSHLNDSLIFVATDGGVYYTLNMGVNWQRLGTNMPLFTIYDITLDEPNKILAAATFARSIWSVSVDSILSSYSLSLVAGGNDTICLGQSVQLQASGAANYSWTPAGSLNCSNCANPIASPVNTTTYIVTGSNGAATATDTIVVTVNPIPVALLTKTGDTIFSSGGGTYQWYFNGSVINNATGSYYVPHLNGNYYVIITNGFGCSKYSNTIAVYFLGLENVIA